MRFNNRAMALAGIPDLPEEAFKHNGDRKIKPQGGGGGGNNTTTGTTYTSNLPEWLRPQMERLVGKTEALSSAPYQAYQGERIAGFAPMQEQAFRETQRLGPAQQIGAGSQLAGYAGLSSLGAGQQYQQMATDPRFTAAYMSPYMEGAVAPELRRAQLASEQQREADKTAAVRAGAYGGSRQGIVEAERQRNLAQLQQDIYGKGRQAAYEAAAKNQQFAAELGLRGAGQSVQAAQALGQLGQTQFDEQQKAIAARQQAGQQQRDLEQQKLTQRYQDFLSQRGHPYQQLAFMSDIMHGIPMGGQTMQQFTAAPSLTSQLGGLGLAAYGMTNAGKKKGGAIKEEASDHGYAGLAELALQKTLG